MNLMLCSDPILFFPNVVFFTHFPHYFFIFIYVFFFFYLLLFALPASRLDTTSTAYVIMTEFLLI